MIGSPLSAIHLKISRTLTLKNGAESLVPLRTIYLLKTILLLIMIQSHIQSVQLKQLLTQFRLYHFPLPPIRFLFLILQILLLRARLQVPLPSTLQSPPILRLFPLPQLSPLIPLWFLL